jgi:membrane protease YdiL (CAAX protease family)
MTTEAVDINWQATDIVSFLPLMLSLVFFTVYWFIAQSSKIKGMFLAKFALDEALVKHLFFTKTIGLISMGIIPLVICLLVFPTTSLADYGLTSGLKNSTFTLTWIGILSIIVIPIAYFSAKKPKNLRNYPQARSKIWTRKMMLTEGLGWFIYLFGYELLFRGILLFPLVAAIGVWPAIGVNIALYSATHIPKGVEETIGAAPLGLVLCILTLLSGNIWIAFFVHVFMAWTNTFTALHFNPEMTYATKK